MHYGEVIIGDDLPDLDLQDLGSGLIFVTASLDISGSHHMLHIAASLAVGFTDAAAVAMLLRIEQHVGEAA